jgi:hypothetical protein
MKDLTDKEKIIHKLEGCTWEGIGDDKIIALAQHLGIKSPKEAEEDIEDGGHDEYTHGSDIYLICDDAEATERVEAYLKDDDYMWKEAVANGNTTEGLDDWAESVIQCDGRGSILNSYDGTEEEEEVNGTVYYIYRR